MNTTHRTARIVSGALLSGGIALAGFGLACGTAQAFNPQPEPPTHQATVGHQPESPGVRVGFDPQPEPPTRPVGVG